MKQTCRSAFCACVLFALAPIFAAADTFSYPHVLEKDGVIIGIAWNPTGGQPAALTGRPVGQPAAAGLGAHVQRLSLYGNAEMFSLVTSAFQGEFRRGDYEISYIGKDTTAEMYKIALEGQGLELPACDVDSKEPQLATLYARHLQVPVKAGISGTTQRARQLSKKEKLWLPANFRLRVGEINTQRTLTVDKVKLMVRPLGDVDGDGKPDFTVDSSDIVFTLPTADAAPFQKLFESTLAGTDIVVPVTIEYLDDEGVPLITVAENVVVVSVGPSGIYLPSELSSTTQVVCKKGLNAVNVSIVR